MKRLNNNFWHLSLALPCMLLAVGCDNNTTPEVESNEPIELQINPTVALTRGVIQGGSGNGFTTAGTTVAVYATGDDYTSSNNYAVYTLQDGGGWSNVASDNNKIFLTSKAATIYAYYPTDNKYDADSKISVTTLEGDENTAITVVDNGIAFATGETDYMYATAVSDVTNKSNNSVTLAMKHALAMITFCVKKDASYAGTGSLTNIKLEDANGDGTTLGKGDNSGLKMDITTGAITGTLVDATYKRKITNGYTLTTSAGKKFSILVLPTAASIGSQNIKATFTIDQANYEVYLTAPTNTDSNKSGFLLAGSNYLYTVKLSGTGLAISAVNVTAWTDTTVDGDLNIN
ncbi:MAG: fimbrillin family protein [Bacteroides sp.]|nr:fimbrillin family protein [Bacteroides sp.]